MIKSHTDARFAPVFPGQTAPDTLPFVVELWDLRQDDFERVLGRAVSLTLARAIYQAALQDFPGRRIVISRGEAIIADSRA